MTELLRAYAVLQGGGIKGPALAGAVAAAQQAGLGFVGYGGTSAGAIVATLFATGYRGPEIKNILTTKVHPRSLLDENTTARSRLSILLDVFRSAKSLLGASTSQLRIIRFLWENRDAIEMLRTMHGVGLYSGEAFVSVLQSVLKDSPLGSKIGDQPITFDALRRDGGPDLKIVAANLTNADAFVFDASHTPTVEIVTAVRASMSYPFVFDTPFYQNQRLTDGGLASNLPVFLFSNEYKRTGFPIIGFDLVDPPRSRSSGYDLAAFADDLASCALGASDRLFREHVSGVEVISVEFEKRISTLNFDVTVDDIRAMYAWGENSAFRFLSQYDRLQIALNNQDDKVRELQLLFGTPKIIEPMLWPVKESVEKRFRQAEDIKISILLPLSVKRGTMWLKCYHFGYHHDDHDIEISSPLELVTIDECVENLKEIVIDVQAGASGSEPRCVAYFPILSPDADSVRKRDAIRAVLRIETTTPIGDTGWVETGLENAYVNDDLISLVNTWTSIIYLLARPA
jgi:NTE family protein